MMSLKPCPFCGGQAEIIEIEEGDNAGGSCVSCTKCLASSNLEFLFKENFVNNWNRRAEIEDMRKQRDQLIFTAMNLRRNAIAMADALAPFAKFAPRVEGFVQARVEQGGSPIMQTKAFRVSDFNKAASALAEWGKLNESPHSEAKP